jgi:hypothetical protein
LDTRGKNFLNKIGKSKKKSREYASKTVHPAVHQRRPLKIRRLLNLH